MKSFKIDPIPKCRMVRSDAWRERNCVLRYWQYKDELKKQAGDWEVPDSNFHIIFYIPMPKSWSKKKKSEKEGCAHTQRPDVDNILKGFWDCLCEEDSHIWDVRATKRWAYEGRIDIFEKEELGEEFYIDAGNQN